MPRDANGNYTLPSGNPVVTNTLISSTWANDTISDLANEMQDSLSRSGKGGFTAPVGIVDKSGSIPGLNFISEPTSGFKREGAGDLRIQVLGNDNIRFLSANRATDVWNNDLSTPAFERVFTTPAANVLDANVEKTVQIKRETTPAVVPGSTAAGELGVNIGDSPPTLYVGDGAAAKPFITSDFVKLPSGTIMLFEAPASAPTGWVKKTDAAYDDRALRIVTGTPGTGGSVAFSTLFGRTTTDSHTLTVSQMPSHNHGGATGNHRHAVKYLSTNNANVLFGSGFGFGKQDSAGDNMVHNTYNASNNNLLENSTASISSQGGGAGHTHGFDNRVQYREAYFAEKS